MQKLSRRLFLAGLAPAAVALAGCGFRPMMAKPESDDSISLQLASIRIGPIGEDEERRVGQILRNELIDRFTAGVGEQPERYVLAIELEQETARDAARDLSNTIAALLALYFRRQDV